MNAIRRRLAIRPSDSGLSLIEIIVSMMVFAIIATGIGYTMLASLNLTKDSSSRQQAATLAAGEIDLTRSIDNLFNLVDKTTTMVINGTTYTIVRTARWVSDPNVDQRCGIGGGVLRYKRVNVSVSWSGMTSTLPTVHADTLIDPGVRINDPALGTILVSVTDSGGNPVPGASVNVSPASPSNGAQPLSAQPPVTDAQGCTYALLVDPGNYNVTVSKSGYVDVSQETAPSKPVSVDASSASSAEVTLDLGANFPLAYATNYAGSVSLPTDLSVSFISTYGTALKANAPGSVTLFPFPAGYQVLAGTYNNPVTPAQFCNSVDPLQWPAGMVGSTNYSAGVRPDAVAAVPGATATTANIPMGVVSMTVPDRSSGSRWYIHAVMQSTGPVGSGNPGCDIALAFDFGRFDEDTDLDLALPFGTWKLYTATSSSGSSSQQISVLGMTVRTNGSTSIPDSTITLDPRAVAP